nr:hypothetical protein B24P11.190 [imported] - Neurospora crassa [Neurospora crassa]
MALNKTDEGPKLGALRRQILHDAAGECADATNKGPHGHQLQSSVSPSLLRAIKGIEA